MGESRWQKVKQWWITNDPDEEAREQHRLEAEHRGLVAVAERLRSTIAADEQLAAAQRRRHLA